MELYAHAPTDLGRTGTPRACEITFRIEGMGKAGAMPPPADRSICWRSGATTQGACGFTPPPPQARPMELTDFDARWDADRLRVRGQLRVGAATRLDGGAQLEVICGAAAPLRDVDLIRQRPPFGLEAGESVRAKFDVGAAALSREPCTLRVAWTPWDAARQTLGGPIVELGTWCLAPDDPSARRPGPPTRGACVR